MYKYICLLILFSKGTLLFGQNPFHPVRAFGHNPGNLKMYIHIPETEPNKLKPLVVALHGCTQTPETFARDTGLSEMAEENDIIVLYPAQKRTNNPYKCFNWFLSKDQEAKGGELESINEMIQYAIHNYPVDTTRIFVFGLSAGAAMGVALLAEYPEVFKSGAIFAGAPYKAATNGLEASATMLRPVDRTPDEWGSLVNRKDGVDYPQLILVQGQKDKTVSPKNATELIEQWSNLCAIDDVPDSVYFYKGTEVRRLGFQDERHKEKLIYFEVGNIGHAVPIDPGTGKEQGGKEGLYAKDVDFFSTYYVLKEFGLME